jgi:phosphoglycolate phosphatase
MPINLLVFDLDGTLVDSSTDISRALNYAIEPYGVGGISVEETITLIGEGVTRLIGKVVQRKEGALNESELLKRFLAYYAAHLVDHTAPYPGTEKTLQALAAFRKVIVSNKTEKFSVDVLKSLDLLKYFDYVAGGDTWPEKKPSPVPVLHVLERFQAKPGEAVLVGDSIYDMSAGRAAGLRTVAALYGYGSPGFSAEADFCIRSINELPDVVRRIGQLV